jgi:hypothetical protein
MQVVDVELEARFAAHRDAGKYDITQSNQQTGTTVIRRTSVDDRVPRCDAAAICFEPCLALSPLKVEGRQPLHLRQRCPTLARIEWQRQLGEYVHVFKGPKHLNVDADCAVRADANRDPFPGVRQVVMQQAAAGQCHRARLAAGGYRPVERGRPPGTVQR